MKLTRFRALTLSGNNIKLTGRASNKQVMEQRLSFVTLGVKDLSAMKEFYTGKFGWEPIKDDQGIVFFKLNGFILALYSADELADDIGIKAQASGFKSFTLSINFRSEKEVERAYEQLTGKGVRGIRKPEKVFWGGFRGYVADPEDNYWELAFNPYLTLDKSGNVASHE
jgi:uncharacterized protein